MAITCWVGEREASTSSPMAFSLTASISCLTTLKLTSASRSATRISRRAASMFAAESLPSPRRFLKTRCSLSDKLSNMAASAYSRLRGEIDIRPGCRAVAFIYYRGVGGSLLVGLEAALGRSGQGQTADAASLSPGRPRVTREDKPFSELLRSRISAELV